MVTMTSLPGCSCAAASLLVISIAQIPEKSGEIVEALCATSGPDDSHRASATRVLIVPERMTIPPQRSDQLVGEFRPNGAPSLMLRSYGFRVISKNPRCSDWYISSFLHARSKAIGSGLPPKLHQSG